MKTSQIARGIVGALSLAGVIGAIGCSADAGYEGAAGEGEIGSTAQALSIASKANLSAALGLGTNCTQNITDPVARENASSCVIHGTVCGVTADFMLVAGGFDPTGGSVLGDAYLYDSANNKYYAVPVSGGGSATLQTPRHSGKMLQVPGHSDQCILVGGEDPSLMTTTLAASEKYTFGSGWANTGNTLRVARSNFELLAGSNNKILVFGGQAGGTAISSVETWDATGNAWAKLQTTVPADVTIGAREFAGVAYDSAHDAFVIAGGDNATGGGKNDIVVLRTPAGNWTNGAATTLGGTLAVDRTQLAVFKEGTVGTSGGVDTTDFIAAGGLKLSATSAVQTSTDRFTIKWNATPALLGAVAAGTALPSALASAKVIPLTSTTMLLGGDKDLTPLSSNLVTVYDTAQAAGAEWTIPGAAPTTLADARVAHVAEFLNGKVYTTTGRKTVAGPTTTRLVSTEEITP